MVVAIKRLKKFRVLYFEDGSKKIEYYNKPIEEYKDSEFIFSLSKQPKQVLHKKSSHFRNSHIRTYKNGNQAKVNSCMVKDDQN